MTQAQQSGSATTTATPAAPETPITRSEVQTMIQEGIQAAVKAATEASTAVQRSEPTPAAPAATTTDESAKPITREDLTAAIKAMAEPLVEAMKGLQGATVLRSAPEAVPSEEDPKKSKDVFRGAFPGLRRAK